MHFRLTYAGELRATRSERSPGRAAHKHDIRKQFHKQLKRLWQQHPVLSRGHSTAPTIGSTIFTQEIEREGFRWKPIVTEQNGLICAIDVLMLRYGPPAATLYDIDNRLKTVFDALRMIKSEQELGGHTPQEGENLFFVLLEDDKLITHLSVDSDMILEPVEGTPIEQSVRLVLNVTVRPYTVSVDNLDFV